MPRKRHNHAWLTFAFALDHIEVYYCGYCLYANFILLVLGTIIFWLFAFIIDALFPVTLIAARTTYIPTITSLGIVRIGSDLPAVTLCHPGPP